MRPLLLLGVLFALMRIADQIALSLTLASYAMAVKRTAGLFSVLLGHWYYGEGHLAARASPAAPSCWSPAPGYGERRSIRAGGRGHRRSRRLDA
jgi:hypothetical protein